MALGLCASESVFLNSTDLTRTMTEIKATGAQRVRAGAAWSQLEPAQKQYTFTVLDAIVNAALNAGLKIDILVPGPKPVWNWWTAPGPADYGNLMHALANRYVKLGVLDYEIWNEQNNALNWGTNFFGFFCSGPNTIQYSQYLATAYGAIKSVSPAARVIFGGMAANLSFSSFLTGFVSQDPVDFLSQCYKQGAKGKFDVLAYHPYSLADNFQDYVEPVPTQKFMAKIADLRALMVANGDSAKPIRLNEFGFDTIGRSQTVQRDWLAEQYVTLSSYQYVDHIYLYNYRDTAADTSPVSHLGIVNFDWSRKLSYEWWLGATKGLAPVTPPKARGVRNTNPPVGPMRLRLQRRKR